MRNKKLRKAISENKAPTQPGVGTAESRRRQHTGRLGLPREAEGPTTAQSSGAGRSREAGPLASHLGPSGMQIPPPLHPFPGPCSHLSLAHQGALSCQC